MSNPKRKLQAKPFITDLRSGMGDEQLMEKYSLSPNQLETAFQKLLNAGQINDVDLFMRTSISDSMVTKAFVESRKAVQELEPPREARPLQHLEAPSEVEITEQVSAPREGLGDIFAKLARRD